MDVVHSTLEGFGTTRSTVSIHMYITSSGDIRYDNQSCAVVIQQKSCARQQISAPSVPSCVHANDLSFKIHVFRVVRVHTAVETKSRVLFQVSEIGEIQVPIAHERRVLSRLDLYQIKDPFLCFLKTDPHMMG